MGDSLVPSATAVLLHGGWRRVHHQTCNSLADAHSNSTAHTTTHDASHAATHSTANSSAAPANQTSAGWSCGSLQLCCRCGEHLGSRQEGMVLSSPSPWLPPNSRANHADHADLASCAAYLAGSSR